MKSLLGNMLKFDNKQDSLKTEILLPEIKTDTTTTDTTAINPFE